MRHLSEYLYEELKEENVKTLKLYINDENFDEILPKIIHICKVNNLIGDEYKSYFNKKGLGNDSYNNNPELGYRISSLFAQSEEDVIHVLTNMVKKENNGLISFDELVDDNEMFKSVCKNFEKVAKEIANINNVISNNANVGKFEILLKLILKENAVAHGHGDVAINYNGGTFNLEVKGGDKKATSARMCGQTIRSTMEASKKFLSLFDIDESDDVSFLGGAASNKRLEKILNDHHITDIDTIIKYYVNAFVFQYGLENTTEEMVNKFIENIIKYNKSANIFSLKNDKVSIKRLTDLMGLIQLFFYSLKDNWDGIFIVNQISGHYKILKRNEILSDFNNVFNSVVFGDNEGNENATGRRCACRIFPK